MTIKIYCYKQREARYLHLKNRHKQKKKPLGIQKECESNEEFCDNLAVITQPHKPHHSWPWHYWVFHPMIGSRDVFLLHSDSYRNFFPLRPVKLQLVSTLCGSEDPQTWWQNHLWYPDCRWVSRSRHPPTHARFSLGDGNPKLVRIRFGTPAPPCPPDRGSFR